MTKLLTEKDAAQMLGCSVHKMQKDRRIGSPLPFVKIGRSVKYRLSDLESYIEQQSYTSTAQYNGGHDGK
ncbi:MAG: helix-turn-helix domain-containing protein [Alphaproteobacteria bacterium]|nr:helix-turn-helix domain-containing protein [Alphaproteobacteria bacterium]